MWSANRTLKENFDHIGLAYDANEVVSKKIAAESEEADIEDVLSGDIDDWIEKQKQLPPEEGVAELKEKLNVCCE